MPWATCPGPKPHCWADSDMDELRGTTTTGMTQPIRATNNAAHVIVADPATGTAYTGIPQTGNPVTYTDRSGTITTGGTAQNAAAANTSRKGLWLQNTSTGNLRVSTRGTASSTAGILVAPGNMMSWPAHGIPTAALSVWGATTGQAFEAAEW